MNILFFDTETTGLVRNWNVAEDERNPKLVQLGCVLTTAGGRVLNTFSSIVKPEGYDIPEEAANVHGITTEIAMREGHPLKEVVGWFLRLNSNANLIVAHNFKFDSIIIRKAISECMKSCVFPASYCTMLESTSLCELPSQRGGFKWPKLKEAYQFFFNEDLVDAHDALTDVLACKRVYFHMRDNLTTTLRGEQAQVSQPLETAVV